MDPAKKRRRTVNGPTPDPSHESSASSRKTFGEETEDDRIKALADAEKKNLWDATEVIDMDTF